MQRKQRHGNVNATQYRWSPERQTATQNRGAETKDSQLKPNSKPSQDITATVTAATKNHQNPTIEARQPKQKRVRFTCCPGPLAVPYHITTATDSRPSPHNAVLSRTSLVTRPRKTIPGTYLVKIRTLMNCLVGPRSWYDTIW